MGECVLHVFILQQYLGTPDKITYYCYYCCFTLEIAQQKNNNNNNNNNKNKMLPIQHQSNGTLKKLPQNTPWNWKCGVLCLELQGDWQILLVVTSRGSTYIGDGHQTLTKSLQWVYKPGLLGWWPSHLIWKQWGIYESYDDHETLPGNNSPLKMDGWKMTSPLGMAYLQGRAVSFRECTR